MKKIKITLLFLLFFINIKNVYASEDIYLEYNKNSIKIDIEDNNILDDNSTKSLEYVYHDSKDNTGLWYLNNKGYNIIFPHIYDWMKELKPYS